MPRRAKTISERAESLGYVVVQKSEFNVTKADPVPVNVVSKSPQERSEAAMRRLDEMARDAFTRGNAPTYEIAKVRVIKNNPDIREDLYAVETAERERVAAANTRPSKSAEFIHRERIEKGVTQAELAQAVGLDASTISKYERGDIRNLTSESFFKVLSALDLGYADMKKAGLTS